MFGQQWIRGPMSTTITAIPTQTVGEETVQTTSATASQKIVLASTIINVRPTFIAITENCCVSKGNLQIIPVAVMESAKTPTAVLTVPALNTSRYQKVVTLIQNTQMIRYFAKVIMRTTVSVKT
jgi:hypothetical protein